MGGAAVEPAGEGKAGPVHRKNFVLDHITVYGWRREKEKKDVSVCEESSRRRRERLDYMRRIAPARHFLPP